MIPIHNPSKDLSFIEFINDFYMSTITFNNIYRRDGTSITPYICYEKENANNNTFYLINNNEDFDMEITMSYEIKGELEDLLHIAVFINDKLSCILSNSPIHYGEIIRGESCQDAPQSLDLIVFDSQVLTTISKKSYVEVKFVVWYDGIYLTDLEQGKVSILTNLEFFGNFI